MMELRKEHNQPDDGQPVELSNSRHSYTNESPIFSQLPPTLVSQSTLSPRTTFLFFWHIWNSFNSNSGAFSFHNQISQPLPKLFLQLGGKSEIFQIHCHQLWLHFAQFSQRCDGETPAQNKSEKNSTTILSSTTYRLHS